MMSMRPSAVTVAVTVAGMVVVGVGAEVVLVVSGGLSRQPSSQIAPMRAATTPSMPSGHRVPPLPDPPSTPMDGIVLPPEPGVYGRCGWPGGAEKQCGRVTLG